MRKIELLAPVGNAEKLNTALRFGADAVYLAGPSLGLRAYAGNFDREGLATAIKTAHALEKKVYVTVNIFAYNEDFAGLADYLQYLEGIGADGVIVSDPGIVSLALKKTSLDVHLSTQANTTNAYSAKFWADLGVKRIVLARELSLKEIADIHEILGDAVELEAFVHGAMCISYSGRCLLSNYLTGRGANHGECVQACRWEYKIHEVKRADNPLILQEDERGSYILNSKDLNMIEHLGELAEAGVSSFKIEGRMKSPYYVATVTNAYRRAIDDLYAGKPFDESLSEELERAGHRGYTTGFYYKENGTDNVAIENSQPTQTFDFVGVVNGYDEKTGFAEIEQRNRFKVGDVINVLSPDAEFNSDIVVTYMQNADGESVEDAKRVQEKLFLKTDVKVRSGDILRMRIKDGK